MSPWEEQQLLASCRRREPEALRQLVELHYDPLYRFLWRLTTSPEEASELTQEAFVRALERLDRFDGRSRFSTWLHALALNLWRDVRRRDDRTPVIPLDEAPDVSAMAACEADAIDQLERDEVRRAVDQLPDAQRIAIVLFYYQGMSYAEIAQICRRPVGTVGSWIHHGLRRLRQILEDSAGSKELRARPTSCPCQERPA